MSGFGFGGGGGGPPAPPSLGGGFAFGTASSVGGGGAPPFGGAPAFGSPRQPQPQQQQGGPGPAGGSAGAGGFGTPAQQQQQQQQPSSGFGGGGAFGSAPPVAAAGAPAPAPSASGFGTPGFGGGASTGDGGGGVGVGGGFGGGPTAGFGQSQPQPQPQPQPPPMTPMAPPTAQPPSSGPVGGGFGSSATVAVAASSNNPAIAAAPPASGFGSSSASFGGGRQNRSRQAPPVSFGASSNIATSSSSNANASANANANANANSSGNAAWDNLGPSSSTGGGGLFGVGVGVGVANSSGSSNAFGGSGGGGGWPQSEPQQQQQQQQQSSSSSSSMGGGASNNNPFGTSGAHAAGAGAGAGGGAGGGGPIAFGTSSNVAASAFSSGGGGNGTGESGFGTSSTTSSVSTTVAANNTSAFGAGAGAGAGAGGGGFGSTSGATTTSSSAFGSTSGTNAGGFGSAFPSGGGGGFGSQQQGASGGSVFGSATAAPSTSGFGGSSGGAFGTAASTSSNQDDGMLGDSTASSSPLPPSSTTATPFGGAIPRKKKPIDSDRGSSSIAPFGRAAKHAEAKDGAGGGGGGGDELSRLKAKLEAKKKKLEEQKRQRADKKQNHLHHHHQQQQQPDGKASASVSASIAAEGNQGGGGKGSRQSASPTPFKARSSRGTTPSPVPPKGGGGGGGRQIDKAAMAAKNAARFATKTDRSTKSLLPSDLRKKAKAIEEGQEEGEIPEDQGEEDEGGKGALSNAKSLIGICRAMCPDEELLRREKEGDIQMLETPDPGGLHPANWTLRDTAVKRFRRSAADFKLDIPELVRPPVVLERCCAYLEEWVMERDRQGPDSRYGGSVPPSLDVYQFIWDRTRMIRKDFILQNYVGTGARCSAAAVRCHERIARWHAMAEHQLSHISDYVVQQSQQNIQELGQTMKTLNFYYDDAEGRATLEEDEADARHGCQNNVVMGGQGPVDYNGTSLNNNDDGSSATSSRIIGTSNHPSRGTAEPEMRGLYILLTLNNDGGMEVLKYAASLYVNRPEIYNSRPVQLALSIFRAKKDYNYARFFTILQSPDTPYLFACVMFKYVEQMRKVALRIMAKTFGARRKDTGENFYDKYSLRDLVHLLCYENEDEAREACQHYNISVVKGEDDGTMGGEWVEWRKTDFKERRDPKKGHVVPLRPWKMSKTIESKLNGTTRLGVCRGEVSGEGATLSRMPSYGRSPQDLIAAQQEQQRKLAAEAKMRAEDAARLQQQKEAADKIEAERRRQAEEQAAKAAAFKRQQEEKERRRREAEEKEKESKRAEQERQEKLRREAEEKKRAEEEAKGREAERLRREREAAARAEAERKKAEEAARLAAIEREREAERKRAEAAERERQRQLALKRAEEERRADAARRLAEEEAARAAEAARIAEEARLRKIREEEERKEREWQRKLDAARKELAFRRWRKRVDDERRGIRQTHQTLERVDPTYPKSLELRSLSQTTSTSLVPQESYHSELPGRPEDLFYRLGNLSGRKMDLSSFIGDGIIKAMSSQQAATGVTMTLQDLTEASSFHFVSLFKLAVIMPTFAGTQDAQDTNLYETLRMWMHSRFAFDVSSINKRLHNGQHIEVRSVIVQGVQGREMTKRYSGCDYALLIIPPPDASRRNECVSFLASQALILSQNGVPFVVLNLDDGSDQIYSRLVRNLIDVSEATIGEVSPHWTANGLDASLAACCDMIRSAFVDARVVDGEPFVIDRVSLPRLGRLCLRNILWDTENIVVEESVKATEHGILRLLKETINCLVLELNEKAKEMRGSLLASWPSYDFSTNQIPFAVPSYWSDGADLSLDWLSDSNYDPDSSISQSPLDAKRIESVVKEYFHIYFVSNTIGAVVEQITEAAPRNIKAACKEMLWGTQYRHALENALAWQESTSESISTTPMKAIIYLPRCEIAGLVERTLKRVSDMCAPRDNVPALTTEATLALNPPTLHKVMDADWKAAAWKPTAALSRGKRRSQKDDDELFFNPSRKKRHRLSKNLRKTVKKKKKKALTLHQRQSTEFSARLEELLHGEKTLDLNIGDVALSDILGKGGESIKLPDNLLL